MKIQNESKNSNLKVTPKFCLLQIDEFVYKKANKLIELMGIAEVGLGKHN